jgi:hypothetical protein
MLISSQINSTATIGHPECIKHDFVLVYGKKFFLYFNVATCWKLSTRSISSQIDSTAKIGPTECIKLWFRAFSWKKCFFLYFNVATCRKLSKMLISSQINSTATIGHPECIKHDFVLVYGKKVFSVFQCCNLLKTVHNVHFISNRQHSKNWTSRVHQTWFWACLWKTRFFCISMFQLAENCPQCSFHLK